MIQNLIKYESDILNEHEFILYERIIPAGTRYPLHWHEFLEFEFLISGSAVHIHNGETTIVESGNAYLMCYNDFHELTALTDITLYSLHFDANILDPKISQYLDFNKFHCVYDKSEVELLLQRIHQLTEEMNYRPLFSSHIIRSIISEIVISMIRKSSLSDIQATPLPLQQAISFLNKNFMHAITLEELAHQLSYSPNYLGQLFKNQLCCTFNDYLNTLRLKYACSLLHSSDIPIKEIACASGYSSVEYFMYVFKKKMCTTPGEYRKQWSSTTAFYT